MQRKFLQNLGLLLLLNLLIKPFWVLGIDRSVQNIVGPESYGIYLAVLNFSFLFSILLDGGITNFNNRNIAQNHQLLNKHFSGIITLKVLLGLSYGFLIMILGWLWGFRAENLTMLAIIGFNQFLLSMLLYLRSNISGLMMFKTDSLVSVLDRLLMILICSVLIWGHVLNKPFEIIYFVYAQTAAYLVTFLVALFIVIKNSGFKKPSWNPAFFYMVLKKSFPFALLILLMSFYYRLDAVMILRLLPEGENALQVGIYAQVFRVLDVGNSLAFLFGLFLLPMFSKMIKLKQDYSKLLKTIWSVLMSFAIWVVLISAFYGTEIMELMYPRGISESMALYQSRLKASATIFPVLMGSFVAVCTSYVFGTLLTANGNLKYLNILAGLGVLTSLLLNLLLIPHLQVTGSAWANLATHSLVALGQFLLSIRLLKLRFPIGFFLKMVLYPAGVFLMVAGLKTMGLSLAVGVASSMLLALILSLSIGLIRLGDLFELLKSGN